MSDFGPDQIDHINWIITLFGITLSGFHCNNNILERLWETGCNSLYVIKRPKNLELKKNLTSDMARVLKFKMK